MVKISPMWMLLEFETQTPHLFFLKGLFLGIRLFVKKIMYSYSYYKKMVKQNFIHIYKKKSQFLRCTYYLKDFYISYLIVVFLILVNVFNVSQIFIRFFFTGK